MQTEPETSLWITSLLSPTQAPERRTIHAGGESFDFNFDTPWPTTLNPCYRQVDEAESNDVWASRYGLDYRKLRRFGPLLLAGYTMPRACERGLRAGARFFSFLFTHDDLFVDRPEASCAELLELVVEYKAVLAGELIAEQPLARMFMQALWDLREFTSDPHHFGDSIVRYLDANVREVRGHGASMTSVDDYRRERLDASGVVPVLELALIVHGVRLPSWVRESKLYASLVEDAMMYICTFNDFVSLPKEIASGDSQNLLTVCLHGEQLASYAEAARHVVERYVTPLIGRFERNAGALHVLASHRNHEQAKAVRDAIQIMRDWMGGHICWEDASMRHGGPRV